MNHHNGKFEGLDIPMADFRDRFFPKQAIIAEPPSSYKKHKHSDYIPSTTIVIDVRSGLGFHKRYGSIGPSRPHHRRTNDEA